MTTSAGGGGLEPVDGRTQTTTLDAGLSSASSTWPAIERAGWPASKESSKPVAVPTGCALADPTGADGAALVAAGPTGAASQPRPCNEVRIAAPRTLRIIM